MSKNVCLERGICICTAEPMGENGLEGYLKDEEYKFEHMSCDKNGNHYYRVYASSEYAQSVNYYETCGPGTFKSFFSIKTSEKFT